MRVGFVGLGAMGLPMTRHLVEVGHEVTVASRSRGPIEAAVHLGANEGDGPRGVAEASDVMILCVPNSPEVVEVIDAALPELGPGKIVVDTSTIDPEVERAQHERVGATGAGYLEAPLSGGTAGAQNGTLTLMVGGPEATLEAARPALDPFAGLIVHVGGPGMGQVVKLCNNLIYAAQMLATAEATVMATKAGVDLVAALRGPDARDRRLRRGANAPPGRGRRPGQPGVERLEAGLHDRPDGEGSRPRDRVRR